MKEPTSTLAMKAMKRISRQVLFSASLCAIFSGFVAQKVDAQIVYKTNSLVTYGYDPLSPFVPSEPTTAVTGPLSSFSYAPTAFQAAVSGATWNIAATSGVVGLTMNANPGNYFDGAALALNVNTKANYNLWAPTATSSAGAAFTAPFTLYVTHVDDSPFATPLLQYPTSIAITPPKVDVIGPGAPTSGQFTGSLTLDINTIKLHFGIGGTNKITGMRLQVSPSLTVYAERASASVSVVNFDVTTQVVPEPSTYALLAVSALALAAFARRRS